MIDFDIAPEVATALANGNAVVALESTIISHGMAYPANLDTARAVEEIVRVHGATPATIAIVAGRVKIGLTAEDLEFFAREQGILKLSTHDLAYCIATGQHGATTVAATMRLAALAKIRVFATGGIGGVHRGVQSTFDISADLTELGRTPVAVIAAGAKAILDLPATVEVLETHMVPVVCVGTDEFPAFYSRSSGLKAPLRLDTAADIAAMLSAQDRLGLNAGALIANPIPHKDEIPAHEIQAAIETALAEAKAQGISAKAVTPFLLGRIGTLTQGRSLKANIALVKNNAKLAAQIAVAYAGL
jgi:pseudouridylate synthase